MKQTQNLPRRILPILLLIGFLAGWHQSIFFPLDKLKLANLSITDDKTSTDKNFQSRALNEVPVSKMME